jgi:hypothetical protein
VECTGRYLFGGASAAVGLPVDSHTGRKDLVGRGAPGSQKYIVNIATDLVQQCHWIFRPNVLGSNRRRTLFPAI